MSAELTDTTASSSLSGLSFLWLEITAKCNLECVHCYADSSPKRDLFGQMQIEDWFTVLRDAADLGCRQVQFIGGEPTLHPDLARMIDFAATCGYTFIEVFTNATVLNKKLLRIFVEHGVHIATSFYSDDPKTHDQITKHPGSFDRSVEVIKQIIAAGLPIRAGIIEMQENAGHTQRAWRFLEELGVSEIKADFQRGVGRGAGHLHSLEPMSQLCGECWKGKLCVTPIGRVYPCVFSRFADMGTVKNGIRSIFSNNTLLDFRTSLREYQQKKVSSDISSVENNEGYAEGQTLQDYKKLEKRECGPDFRCRPTCGPCQPAEFSEPCNPKSTPCPPEYFCGPDKQCSPDTRCAPNSGPRSPDELMIDIQDLD